MIYWLKEQYNKRTDIHFSMDMPTDNIKINGKYSTAIFRITQEALTNIIRHANAKHVNIKMEINNSEIVLRIEDDGYGIRPDKGIEKNKTFGVFGMKERASILGGEVQIKNNIKHGTTVQLILPYKQEPSTKI